VRTLVYDPIQDAVSPAKTGAAFEEVVMFPVEAKENLVDIAIVISTALVLTRVVIIEFIHVVESCKECKRRVVGRR